MGERIFAPLCPVCGGSLVHAPMHSHPLSGDTAVRPSRDFLTVLSIISVIVLVTTEAGAAFAAAAWGLSGLMHLPVSLQDGLYGVAAIATVGVAVWIGRRAFDADTDGAEFDGAAQ